MTEIDEKELEEFAKDLAGNWREFDSFAWFEQPDDADNCGIWYTSHRDAKLSEESNAEAINEELKPLLDADDPDVWMESHNHWAVGWVAGYVIRVYDDEGKVTAAARKVFELKQRLEDYPLLDEDDYSEREYESALKRISEEGGRFLKDGTEDGWEGDVFSWLWKHEQHELENTDDTGAAPSEESIKAALKALDLLDPEYDEEHGEEE
jgi:hypothetical protein